MSNKWMICSKIDLKYLYARVSFVSDGIETTYRPYRDDATIFEDRKLAEGFCKVMKKHSKILQLPEPWLVEVEED